MTNSADKKGEDHWDSSQYQSAAGFVPKLATKVIGWLDVKSDDVILDIGCGGEFTSIFQTLKSASLNLLSKGGVELSFCCGCCGSYDSTGVLLSYFFMSVR